MSEWLKEHAWKVCIPQKGIESSNLSVSAIFFQYQQGLSEAQPYICLITNKQPIVMTGNKFPKESRDPKPRYTVDKYGLLVNLQMSETDELVIRHLLKVVNNKGQSTPSNWPKTPSGMPWCESC